MDGDICRRTVEALERRGYGALFAPTAADALALVMKEAEGALSVAWGGSETLKEIGARDALLDSGKTLSERENGADLFLLSANALTADGVIVNIDGRGNRVAASIYGPKKVVYVVGVNKIVEGGVEEAIARAKSFACPPNSVRLSKKTPCAQTGKCADCSSPDRICKVTVVFDRPPTRTPTKVIVVGEKLGY